jgi:hypothetical protein
MLPVIPSKLWEDLRLDPEAQLLLLFPSSVEEMHSGTLHFAPNVAK